MKRGALVGIVTMLVLMAAQPSLAQQPAKVDQKKLKKTFPAAKANYDDKSKTLTFAYDFQNDEQLKDFQGQQVAPLRLRPKAMALQPASSVQHIAKFTTVTFKGIWLTQRGMPTVRLSDCPVYANQGWASNGGAGGVSLRGGVGGEAWAGAAKAQVPTPLLFSFSNGRAELRLDGNKQSAMMCNAERAGHVILEGGKNGIEWANIEIAGIPDPIWFRQFTK